LNFVKLHGGILAVDALINNIIKELNLGTEANATLIEMILLTDENILRSKPRLGCIMYFHLPSITKVSVEEVHKAALEIFKRRKDVMSKTALYEAIAERIASRASMVFIDACLNLFEDIVY
jgi:hypothetical protein